MEAITKNLPAAVRQQLLRSDASALALLDSLWIRMVGRGIAQQCRPADFAAGTLTITTSCPNWAVQIRQLHDEIRHNINRVLGCDLVKKMRVRLDPGFKPAALPQAAPGVGVLRRARIQGSQDSPQDALGVLRESCEKYFARKDRKTN